MRPVADFLFILIGPGGPQEVCPLRGLFRPSGSGVWYATDSKSLVRDYCLDFLTAWCAVGQPIFGLAGASWRVAGRVSHIAHRLAPLIAAERSGGRPWICGKTLGGSSRRGLRLFPWNPHKNRCRFSFRFLRLCPARRFAAWRNVGAGDCFSARVVTLLARSRRRHRLRSLRDAQTPIRRREA